MGCQPSRCLNEVHEAKRRSTILERPKASITVGLGIEHSLATDTRVVFIFGKLFIVRQIGHPLRTGDTNFELILQGQL